MNDKPYWIVSVQGDRFLGYGGGMVIEYPDARVFETESEAKAAARKIVNEGGYARAVKSTDYADGSDTGEI